MRGDGQSGVDEPQSEPGAAREARREDEEGARGGRARSQTLQRHAHRDGHLQTATHEEDARRLRKDPELRTGTNALFQTDFRRDLRHPIEIVSG